MARASGTATDFIDFLRLFRDYAIGTLNPATHPTITVGTQVSGANATGTLTLTANAGNTETVTINGKVYTFQTTLTNVDGNVLIGANASASLDNLIDAINLGAGAGTDYATATTLNQHVTAAAGAGDTMDVTAKISGHGGNLITTTETLANGSWGGATLTGGSGDRWSSLPLGAGMTALPGSGFATDGEMYLSGPGSDPADQIIVGFRTYRNAGNNIFGFESRGYTGYNSGLTFTTLPGASPSAFTALDDATMSVWFWVNARRIMALARIGTTDILIHSGFIQQFGTRGQYPYPLLITGSQQTINENFQVNHFGQSCLPDPCDNGAYLRWVDGSWQEFRNYTGNGAVRSQMSNSIGNLVWPLRDPTTDPHNATQSEGSETLLFEQFSTSATQLSSSGISSYQLFSAVLMDAANAIGRVDGLYVVGGLGLVSGDTITIGSDVYDVFKNTWRSEAADFFAVLRA